MTPQDIEKLKAICKEEGIEMIPTKDTGVYAFKSEWMGVEFVRCISAQPPFFTEDKIYPVIKAEGNNIWVRHCDDGDVNSMYIRSGEPATENDYVEQLKAKVKELYGEIKNGDRFDCYMLDPSFIDHELAIVTRENNDFAYIKKWDRLYKSGVTIYQQGKWSKKVEEPIRVNISGFTLSNPYSTIVFTTSHRIKDGQVDVKEFMNHIEESIEAFLNRKP